MSDPEPPEGGGQAEPDRSFARLRNLLRLVRRARDGESLRDTIDEMIEEPSTEGPHPLSAHEHLLIGNILKVHNRTAADVMVPRIDIVALNVETPFPEVVKCMVEQGHSRVPVYRETLDDVIGFIHVKDVLGPVADRQQQRIEVGAFARIEAGGRLVKAKQHGIGAHRARDFEPPLVAIGQIARRIVGAIEQADAA